MSFPHHEECHTKRCARKADVAYGRHHRPKRHAMSSAGASWFDDSGAIACGEPHYKLGVANKELACGTKVELCAARCVVARVEDRGPYIEGRQWDLNPAVKSATGFGDTGQVRWRVLG